MLKHVIMLLMISVLASGCLWPFASSRSPSPAIVRDSVSVEILNPEALAKAARVYFMPLAAGPEAEAGEALDHLALMVVKGCSDAMEKNGRLTMVTGDAAHDADLVIKGHMQELKLKVRDRLVAMTVRADVRLRASDEVIAIVFAERNAAGARVSADQAAYDVGYVLGEKLSQERGAL